MTQVKEEIRATKGIKSGGVGVGVVGWGSSGYYVTDCVSSWRHKEQRQMRTTRRAHVSNVVIWFCRELRRTVSPWHPFSAPCTSAAVDGVDGVRQVFYQAASPASLSAETTLVRGGNAGDNTTSQCKNWSAKVAGEMFPHPVTNTEYRVVVATCQVRLFVVGLEGSSICSCFGVWLFF